MMDDPAEWFRRWFHSLITPCLLCTPEGRILAANPAAKRLFGEDPSGARLQDWTVEPPRPLGEMLRHFAASTQRTPGRITLEQEGDPRALRVFGARLPQVGAKGAYHLLLQLQPVEAKGDLFARLNQELAELQRRQRQLAREKAHLADKVAEGRERLAQQERLQRTILETVDQAIVAIDERGRIQTFNPAAERIFGYRADEVLGGDVSLLMPQEHARRHHAYLQRYLDTGVAHILGQGAREVTGCDRRGEPVPLEISVAEAEGEDGRLFVAALRDISERKHHERLLQEHVQALERSNRELEQFVYVASHDLKAPLRAIANLSSWIEEDLGERLDDPEIRRQLDLLRGRVRRMEALIDGLLTYSRAGRAGLRLERLAVGEWLHEVVDSLAPPPGFTVQWEDLPELHTDRLRLGQVFSNLIGNAIKHHHDPERGHVWVRAERSGGWVRFSVCDDGPGIDPRYHDKIFHIFQTLKSRDEQEGTGIGLALVKKLVEEQGGEIEVRSAPREGTCFQFTWPEGGES